MFNGGLGGAPSSYMEVCSKMHIPVYADIIIAEFNVNDESNPSPPVDNVARRSFERMLRKLLDYPNKPAVIILNAFRWFKTFSGEVSWGGTLKLQLMRNVSCNSPARKPSQHVSGFF